MDDDGLVINISSPAGQRNVTRKNTRVLPKGSWKRKHLASKAAASRAGKREAGRAVPMTGARTNNSKVAPPSAPEPGGTGAVRAHTDSPSAMSVEAVGPNGNTASMKATRKRPLDGSGAPTRTSTEPPPKKKKLNSGRTVGSMDSSDLSVGTKGKGADRRLDSKTFVSSLFSSNPSLPETVPSTDIVKVERTPQAPLFGASSFEKLGISPFLSRHLQFGLNLSTPTSVQQHSFPVLLNPNGRDCLVRSPTGSGKTLAYLGPIIDAMLKVEGSAARRDRTGVLAVVVAPTRELAGQIWGVANDLVNWKSGRKQMEEGLGDDVDRESGSDNDNPNPISKSDHKMTSAISEDDAVPRPHHWLTPVLLTGGAKRKSEKARIRRGAQVIVATPGRLLDHIRTTASLDASNVRWLVLDEADRLVEEGMEDDLKACVRLLNERWKGGERKGLSRDWDASLPGKRRTVLCSATVEAGVVKMAGWLMREKAVVVTEDGTTEWRTAELSVAGADSTAALTSEADSHNHGSSVSGKLSINDPTSQIVTPVRLRQLYIPAPYKLRLVTLASLLRRTCLNGGKCVTFTATQDVVEWLWTIFSSALGDAAKSPVTKKLDADSPTCESSFLGAPVTKLHGGLSPQGRAGALRTFLSSSRGVLLTTSLAARGLDVPDVSLVVQLDPPHDVEEYVHRVGRTARIGRTGEAVIFVAPEEAEYVGTLQKRGMAVERMEIETVVTEGLKGWGRVLAKPKGKSFNEWEVKATDLQMIVERKTLERSEMQSIARAAYTAHLRAYSTHPAVQRSIFHLRKLHLGHVAKSFGLRDTPTVAGVNSKDASDVKSKVVQKRQQQRERSKLGWSVVGGSGAKKYLASEFGDGF
ncbi:ATP-dependent RNA helicase dbp7 [Gonapodya sp. JEL0774]|nr:ATP-dependent RNA helicase dbp7 [Gonapodya sp. JEL0774]